MDDSDLVDRYKARIVELRTEYERAVANAEQAGDEALDLPDPDGSLAYRNALIAESAALKAYERAVLDLAETMLHGEPKKD
jgi:hypothetical protein